MKYKLNFNPKISNFKPRLVFKLKFNRLPKFQPKTDISPLPNIKNTKNFIH